MRKSAGRRNKAMYCVIMGDIINSREINDDNDNTIREKVTRAAQSAFDRINTEYIGSLMADFGMVRGDAFEGVMLTQSYAPKIVRDIIKAFYSVEKTIVRISVVLGELTVIGNNRNITDGPAFHRAQDELERMKKSKSEHWLQVSFDIGPLGQALVDSQLALLTALTEGWTDKQRELVWAMEAHDHYQKAVANKLNMTTANVSKQLKAAGYEAYRKAWDGLEDYLAKMDEYAVEDKPTIEKSYVPYFNVAWRKAQQQADWQRALKPADESLQLAQKAPGADDSQLIPIYNLLAEIYTMTGQYDKAEETILESLRIQEPMPKARLEYAATMGEKARFLWKKRNYEEAKKTYEDALKIARGVADEGHPFVVELNGNLALIYDLLGDYFSAKNLNNKVLADMDIRNDPVNYAAVKYNIAICHYNLDELPEAVRCMEEALRLYEENLPPKHKYMANARESLSQFKSHLEGIAI